MSATIGVWTPPAKKVEPVIKTEKTEVQEALDNMTVGEIMKQVCNALDVADEHPRFMETPDDKIDRAISLSKWAVLAIGGGRAKKAKAPGKER